MNPPGIDIDDEALVEAIEAHDFYAAIRPELGADFSAQLESAMRRIVANPLAWPEFTARTRRYLLDRFPYTVVYVIRSEGPRVVAVFHQHRRPGYWKARVG